MFFFSKQINIKIKIYENNEHDLFKYMIIV